MSLAQKQKIKQLKHPSIHWQLFQRLSKSRKAFLNLSKSFNSLQRLFDLLEFSVSRGLQGFSGYLMCLENWGLNPWQFFLRMGQFVATDVESDPPSPLPPHTLPSQVRETFQFAGFQSEFLAFYKALFVRFERRSIRKFNRTHNSSKICDSRYFFQTISRFSKSLHWSGLMSCSQFYLENLKQLLKVGKATASAFNLRPGRGKAKFPFIPRRLCIWRRAIQRLFKSWNCHKKLHFSIFNSASRERFPTKRDSNFFKLFSLDSTTNAGGFYFLRN